MRASCVPVRGVEGGASCLNRVSLVTRGRLAELMAILERAIARRKAGQGRSPGIVTGGRRARP
jgi:hypothetical protein